MSPTVTEPISSPPSPPSPTSPEPRPWASSRPTPVDLARQVRDVIADLPLFLTSPLLRRWHLRWGASPAEIADGMPGDDLFPEAQYRSTRAITIAAPPEEVWPWLVQVGCLRAGWYSDDLLDDLAHPSARAIVPELQNFAVGSLLPMAPTPSASSAFVVDSFEFPRWMLWRTPSSTWAWRLVPLPEGRTRLITRLHAVYDWRRISTVLWVPLMECGDFPMMRRMLRGLRERAEATHQRQVPPPVDARGLALRPRAHSADRSAAARFRAHVVNPVVRVILRSPAHRALSGSVLFLEYTGHRSGRRYGLPVMYASSGDGLVVMAGQPAGKTWWRNFGCEPQAVAVTLGAQRTMGAARLLGVGTEERRQAVEAYRRRFPTVMLDLVAPVLFIVPGDPATRRPHGVLTPPRP